MKKEHILLIIFLLGGYLLFAGLFVKTTNPADESMIGIKAPLFNVEAPDHQPFEIKNHIGQKIILVNLWATWCPPCRDEVPVLNTIQAGIDSSKFMIVSIMIDDSSHEDKIKQLEGFKKKIPVNFPVYFDKDNTVAESYGTFKLPESYLIDLSGTIIYKHVGPIMKWDRENMMAMILKAAQ